MMWLLPWIIKALCLYLLPDVVCFWCVTGFVKLLQDDIIYMLWYKKTILTLANYISLHYVDEWHIFHSTVQMGNKILCNKAEYWTKHTSAIQTLISLQRSLKHLHVLLWADQSSHLWATFQDGIKEWRKNKILFYLRWSSLWIMLVILKCN